MTARPIDVLRNAHWLTRERAVAWATVLLVLQAMLLLFLALWQHGVFFAVETPSSSDFVSFYAAGKLALAGTPALAYDQAAHYIAQQQARVEGAPYQFFFYPPVFLLLCSALATLPYFVAYALFQCATLSLFLLMMRRVLNEPGWAWLIPVLAFPPVLWTIGLGQNAFLTAALFAGFTLLIDRRPGIAGILLGLLCYKPHFGLLAPIALLAGKRWHAIGAATATVIGLIALSALLFGLDTWRAYLDAFAGSQSVYTSGRIDPAGMVTLFGGALLFGLGAKTAYALQTVAALGAAALLAFVWRNAPSQSTRAAILPIATLLAVPLALLYDQLLALVAMAWMLREARSSGFLPWEKLVLLLAYPSCLLTWLVGTAWHIPLGPAVSLSLLALCMRRIQCVAPKTAGSVDKTEPALWAWIRPRSASRHSA